MQLAPQELHHHIQTSSELKRLHDLHRLRDELGLDPQGTLAHLAHLERYLPQDEDLGQHTKKFWLECLAAAMRCEELSLPLSDPLSVWLLSVLPALGYEVDWQTSLRDNLAIVRTKNIAEELHEGILDLARALSDVQISQEERLIIPHTLRGYELTRLQQARQLHGVPGVRDVQVVLQALILLVHSGDGLPESFPNLRTQGKQSLYDPAQHIIYVDLHHAWRPEENRYHPPFLTPALVGELRHYLVHYLDERVARRIGLDNRALEQDTVRMPYLRDLHHTVAL